MRAAVFALSGCLAAGACTASSGARDTGAPPADASLEGDAGTPADAGATDSDPPDSGLFPLPIPAEPQRDGDPARGYSVVVDGKYVGCGVPYSVFQLAGQTNAAPSLRLPGRSGPNQTMQYDLTVFTASSGVQLVAPNCLHCHASKLRGEIYVGLGDATQDFTGDPAATADLPGLLITDAKERREWMRWRTRVIATAPYVRADTIGVNPADNLAAILFSRRDPVTLAWSDSQLLDPPPSVVVPVDVPPWWRMKKKTSMFYVGAGRGDLGRIMMTSSTLCVDTVAEAREIDRGFGDVRAFVNDIAPPPYPFAIDAEKANRGEAVFNLECARCHGTYGGSGGYPNLWVPLELVETDPVLALGASQYTERFLDWYRRSFYGETSRLEPVRGYVAPPLDGIWATGPFLHNGSVPTLAALLESSKRPTYWTWSYDTNDFDEAQLGWRYTEVDHGQSDEPDPNTRRRIYDTTKLAYGNGGHTFGDALTEEDRSALLEYLKKL